MFISPSVTRMTQAGW